MPMYARMPLPSEMIEEQPTYVNAKQYRRIIKRRQARAKLEQRRKIPSNRKVTFGFVSLQHFRSEHRFVAIELSP